MLNILLNLTGELRVHNEIAYPGSLPLLLPGRNEITPLGQIAIYLVMDKFLRVVQY
jgi:hypothetical protein